MEQLLTVETRTGSCLWHFNAGPKTYRLDGISFIVPVGFLLYGRCSSLSSSHGSCVMAEQMLEPRAIRFLPGGYILGQRKQGKGMLELQVTSPSFTGLFLCYTFELTSCLRTTRMNRNSSCPQINPHDAVKRARGLATPMKGSSSRTERKDFAKDKTVR